MLRVAIYLNSFTWQTSIQVAIPAIPECYPSIRRQYCDLFGLILFGLAVQEQVDSPLPSFSLLWKSCFKRKAGTKDNLKNFVTTIESRHDCSKEGDISYCSNTLYFEHSSDRICINSEQLSWAFEEFLTGL